MQGYAKYHRLRETVKFRAFLVSNRNTNNYLLINIITNKQMPQTIHIGEEIRQRLLAQEGSVTWLAKKINCDRSNLNKNLQCPHIHHGLLYRISVALGVDFFARYSQQLQEVIQGQG